MKIRQGACEYDLNARKIHKGPRVNGPGYIRAALFIDSHYLCSVIDEGRGGALRFEYDLAVANNRRKPTAAQIATAPVLLNEARQWLRETAGKCQEVLDEVGPRSRGDADLLVEALVAIVLDEAATKEAVARRMRSKVLFIDPNDHRLYSRPILPVESVDAAIDSVRAKYKGALILNTLPTDAAYAVLDAHGLIER